MKMSKSPETLEKSRKPKLLGLFPDEVAKQSLKFSSTLNSYSQIPGICRCCGQLNDTLLNMRGNICMKDGIRLWGWFAKFIDFQTAPLRKQYAHICNICLRKLMQAYKFQQQCLMAENVFQAEPNRKLLPPVRKLKMFTCKVCAKEMSVIFRIRHEKMHRRGDLKSKKSNRKAAKVAPKKSPATTEKSHNEPEKKSTEAPTSQTAQNPSEVNQPAPSTQDSQSFCCDVCGEIVLNSRNLWFHKRMHQHECKLCFKTFSTAKLLLDHTKARHAGASEPIIAQNKEALVIVQCDICKKKYCKSALPEHMKRMHGVKKKSKQCPICGQMFFDGKELKWHVVKHSNPTPFECDKCDKKYAWKHNLVNHTRTEHESNKYDCELCDKSFVIISTLRNHVLLKHKGAKLRCHICMIDTYICTRTLKNHLKKVHKTRYDQSVNMVLPNNEKLMRSRTSIGTLIQTCNNDDADSTSTSKQNQ